MKALTNKEFIQKAKEIHGDKYDYSLVEYKNARTKVKIICPIHGIFEQTPDSHINRKTECPKCGHSTEKNRGIKDNLKTFIQKAKEVHGDKYDYSLVEYKNSSTKIKIICPKHGVFEQTPNNHLSGCGCLSCSFLNKASAKEQFIEKARKVHGNKYDYSLVDYKNNYTKIKIICSKHGVFEQTPDCHSRLGAGCPHCKSSKGEQKINLFLKERNILFVRNKTFDDLKDKKFLSYDFYTPEYNLLIEYNGKQHYKENSFKRHDLKLQRHHDWLKRKYAKNHNIKLLTIPYWDYKIIENILEENLMADEKITYDIKEHIGVISKNEKTNWQKEINLISWCNHPEKYDIRDWCRADDGVIKMGKGLTLTKEEALKLKELLATIN